MNFLSTQSKPLKPNIDFLKLVAIITMIIDHVNYIIFNREYLYLTYIGRIAFPLFAFILAYNFYYNTSNKTKYLERILIFAFISQPFYSLAIGTTQLNIFFTLGIGMICLLFCNKKKLWYLPYFVLPLVWFILATSSSVMNLPDVDYGLFGVLLVYSIGLFLKNYQTMYGFLVSIFLILINFKTFGIYTLYKVLATVFFVPIVYLSRFVKGDLRALFQHKYFFYIFYPGHLFLLWVLKVIVDLTKL